MVRPHRTTAEAVADRRPDHGVLSPERPTNMSLDLQAGVRVYQFVVDRLDDRRREQYPDGREEYETDWSAAHGLEKAFAEAVYADDSDASEHLLQKLRTMAAPWQHHPHHPDHHADGGRQPEDTVPGSQL